MRTIRCRLPCALSRHLLVRRPLSTISSHNNNESAISQGPPPSAEPGRPLSTLPTEKLGLYEPSSERDSCGVGLVVHLKSEPSRDVVDDANQMLVRMSHRGGCGCDPYDGDGAGMLVGMPHEFMRKVAREECGGLELPPNGEFGVGNIFVGAKGNPALKAEARLLVERTASEDCGLEVLGWRTVPVDNSELGAAALKSEPITDQCFVAQGKKGKNKNHLGNADDPASSLSFCFERELFRLQKLSSLKADKELTGGDSSLFYVCSMSAQTVTYKGQLTPSQVLPYFSDLRDPSFTSHLALVHSRFSTNTFPSWDRAQPLRVMCHNGEINTLKGNKKWMQSREGLLKSSYFKEHTQSLLPSTSDRMSDSGNLDAVLELLAKAGDDHKRTLPECVMMMIPEAWQDNPSLSPSQQAWYRYHSCLMEPWDGPAMVAFTDGRFIGATLDRNGLRPSRYYVTHDDRVLLSSEIGVLPELCDSEVKHKRRLEPGKMLLVDLKEKRIVPDAEIKESAAASQPYGEWLQSRMFELEEWTAAAHHAKKKNKNEDKVANFNFTDSTRRFNMFGYTTETMDLLLYPMAVGGKEALGSMGNDASLAVLSEMPRNVFDYFKQLFAQVTNPPIDPIREEMVMSLVCPVGPEANLLAPPGPQHCARLVVNHPILSLEEMEALKTTEYRGWRTAVIDATFEAGSSSEGLQEALGRICEQASDHLHQGDDFGGQGGVQGIVLSDRLAGPKNRLPIPSLLAIGAVHQHLLQTQQRSHGCLFLEAGDAREVHDFATLLGFGADGVCPWVAYEALAKMNEEGQVEARAKQTLTNEELFTSYRNSAAKGLLKVMAKMGISTLQSYKGAQAFEIVGLNRDVVDRCFTGTTSRIQGADFEALYIDLKRFHSAAMFDYDSDNGKKRAQASPPPLIPNPGNFNYRDGGEAHLNTPSNMLALQKAARENSREAYKHYSQLMDSQTAKVTLRGLLKFDDSSTSDHHHHHPSAVPLEEVEAVEEIVKRFVTGAMSLGSISQETHETLAVAMNRLGARSNTGEGGEDPVRFLDDRRSAIKQVASGRFGVTSHYLANSDQIQIKMAQGAKPGEGGELPGFKVTPYIGDCRGTTPGVGLISPPPHHDVYSIEDLAQLIHDLKNAQPEGGSVSVKLVSEVGVGVVAAGVAKAKADHVTVSGGDGGTGAAAWTGVKGAGLPWELGLAETHQTLVLNGLRSRVRLQTDGQLKNGRDVVVAALLGAEEFGFSTAPLIALGCVMMRKCHLNTCPVGIATQDPELRKKFSGQPEHVMNFFWLLAEEVRELMATLGYRTIDEMVGQTQRLAVDEMKMNYKSKGLDLSPLLLKAADLNPQAGLIHSEVQQHNIDDTIDRELIRHALPVMLGINETSKERFVVLEHVTATNLQRSLGTMLSYHVSKHHGKEGLPDKTIHVKLCGHGGQSLGFCLAKGDSNDGVGKCLSGGTIAVYPSTKGVTDSGFEAGSNVVVGNVCLYGASSGAAYLGGLAGERFAVRNSGALAVVEGVGDHGCEYMTGGQVVILGETGRNFGAGMSGGTAYVYDPKGLLPGRCNMGTVVLEKVGAGVAGAPLPLGDGHSSSSFPSKTTTITAAVTNHFDESEVLRSYIEAHVAHTGSVVGKKLLDSWSEDTVQQFAKVMPVDYKRVLEEEEASKAKLVA